MKRRRIGLLLVITGCVVLALPSPAGAAPAKINGSGSTYVALAMQQWVADAQIDGLQVNYLPTGSPQGLTSFGQGLVDFAGTEAEYSALGVSGGEANRGYQYVPDVAGAVAVMYNVVDTAGRRVDYLHLTREAVARIFIGAITHWDDAAILASNPGLQLPHEPITVVYRGGQSGTTALFYDFIQHTIPSEFDAWAARNRLPTTVRIIQLDSSPNFAPKTQALNGSDQIAQHVASSTGRWSIAYDEFGYAKTYRAPAAWVQNAAGKYVLPYAENISAALEGARLRADLSQELSGVYGSTNPLAYPVSAYSYMVTQCEAAGDRPTCKGSYTNGGVTETLSQWLRYIACDGQVNMARIGYSPLPPNLSQEIANSIARMTGGAPEQLNAGNCANPRFSGSLGAGASSPPDPYLSLPQGGPTATGGVTTRGSGSTVTSGSIAAPGTSIASGGGVGGAATPVGGVTSVASVASGAPISAADIASGAADVGDLFGDVAAGAGDPASVAAGALGVGAGAYAGAGALVGDAGGGAAASWRAAAPVAYDRPLPGRATSAPLAVVVLLVGLALLLPARRDLEVAR